MTFGLDSTGFTLKRQVDVLESMEDRARVVYGAGVNLDPDGVLGRFLGIMSEAIAEPWQQAQNLYDAFNAANAQGVQLDNLAGLLGLTRLPATASTVELDLSGTAATLIPAGSLVSIGPTGAQWATDVDATLDGGGSATVTATAVELGAITANPTAIGTIVTPLLGWADVDNPAAATPGRDLETDAQLRLRMLGSSSIIGSATVNAIRARLLELDDVQAAFVIDNVTDVVDGDGRPPHSVEAIVHPATVDGQSIADLLFANVAAGIQTTGQDGPLDVVDSQGITHVMRWTYADPVPVDVTVVGTKASVGYPADGDAQIEAKIRAYIQTLPPGADVLLHEVIGAVAEVDGLITVVVTMRRDAAPFAAANVAIDFNEIALDDAVSVTVT
jgi:uncharacterized phage protein gp47/JayE